MKNNKLSLSTNNWKTNPQEHKWALSNMMEQQITRREPLSMLRAEERSTEMWAKKAVHKT